MEADWDELARTVVPGPSIHAGPTIATTIAFDEDQELLWVGNEHVCKDGRSPLLQLTVPLRVGSLHSMGRSFKDMSLSKLTRVRVESINSYSMKRA